MQVRREREEGEGENNVFGEYIVIETVAVNGISPNMKTQVSFK